MVPDHGDVNNISRYVDVFKSMEDLINGLLRKVKGAFQLAFVFIDVECVHYTQILGIFIYFKNDFAYKHYVLSKKCMLQQSALYHG